MKPGRGRRKKYFQQRLCAPVEARHPVTGAEIRVNYQRDSMIQGDLDEELTRYPGTLSWYLQLRNQAETDLDDAKHEELNVSEDLSIRIREKIESRGEKATETQIKTMVKAHPKMRKAFRRRMRAEEVHRELAAAVEAMIEKKWAMKALVDYRRIDNNPDSY